MSRRRRGHRTGLLLLVGLITVGGVALAQQEETPEERRARWDRGPQTIDVSHYPPEMQERYELFAEKCSKCHNLSRPINAEFAPEEWATYLDKMMRKKGSGIGKKDKQEIYQFLCFDTQIRKPLLLRKTPDTRPEAQPSGGTPGTGGTP